jgi:hypothetical protein
MPDFLPTPLRSDTDPLDEQLRAVVERIARQIAALQEENARLRKALADERQTVDMLLLIDQIGIHAAETRQ